MGAVLILDEVEWVDVGVGGWGYGSLQTWFGWPAIVVEVELAVVVEVLECLHGELFTEIITKADWNGYGVGLHFDGIEENSLVGIGYRHVERAFGIRELFEHDGECRSGRLGGGSYCHSGEEDGE